jgi:hypothetical protein
MRAVRRAFAVVAVSALVALGPAAARPAAAAEAGRPGACTDDAGVTVVVDFRALGGDLVERCAPGPGGEGFTGLDALTGAGFSAAGTQRWGMEFVCRIQGEPAASDRLSIPGDDSYREDCGDTPPETAYWSYWYASNGGDWKYSSISSASRSTVKGGFEGWVFHLGSSSPKAPAVPPRHPVSAPTQSPPTSATPPTRSGGGQHGGQSGGQSGGGRHGGSSPPISSATSAPPPSPTSAAPTTSAAGGDRPPARHGHGDKHQQSREIETTRPPAVDATRSTDGPAVATALPDEPDDGGSGSPTPFLLGAGVVVLLGAGAGATAWRRSHRG